MYSSPVCPTSPHITTRKERRKETQPRSLPIWEQRWGRARELVLWEVLQNSSKPSWKSNEPVSWREEETDLRSKLTVCPVWPQVSWPLPVPSLAGRLWKVETVLQSSWYQPGGQLFSMMLESRKTLTWTHCLWRHKQTLRRPYGKPLSQKRETFLTFPTSVIVRLSSGMVKCVNVLHTHA